MKRELRNSLVELNLQGIITDKELITFNKRLESKFLNSLPKDEALSVRENEASKEVCQTCGYHEKAYHKYIKEYYCPECGNIWETGEAGP